MRIILKVALLFLPFAASAQLTLDECQNLARDNYPLLKRYDLIAQSTDYSISNINRGYLPQISVTAQATLQSDVATLPDVLVRNLEAAGGEYLGLGKDQYRIALELNQVIWDGGNIGAQKDIVRLDGEVQSAQTDVDLYAIRSRVNDMFFGLLLIEDRINLNQDLQDLLADNCRKMETRRSNGMATQADVDLMRAEYLNSKQAAIQLASMKTSFQQMLALFIGKNSSEVANLQKPSAALPSTFEVQRPELDLFASKLRQLDAQENSINASLMPRLSLFAQGFYGYPGYNMFNDMFDHDLTLNGIVGVRLAWNFSNLYTQKNNKQKLAVARNMVENAQETFLFNNRMQSTREIEAIEQYRKMMLGDEEIIVLRTSIRKAAESKFELGVIDVNDLLQEITRENQARTDHSIHEIEMLKNIHELRNTINR